jgi:hypothetical protein
MADTVIKQSPEQACSDCGKLGTSGGHWGPLVPPGTSGDFCPKCWQARIDAGNRGEEPKPLGYVKAAAEWDGFPLGEEA